MAMSQQRPIIGITMGDPCGIGAEVIVKAVTDPAVARRARYVVFGLSEQLDYTAGMLELDFDFFRDYHENVRRYDQDLVVLDYDEITMPAAMQRGPSRVGGQASFDFVTDAIAAARGGLIDAMVTAPISKASWTLAGIKKFPGHTELLAKICKRRRVAMMFVAPQLRVVLATIHEAIAQVPNKLNIGAVFTPLDLVHQALKEWFDVPQPRIAVTGLNPHAGEEGKFGDEEDRIIAPAILMARQAGIDAVGPFPADTLFGQAAGGRYDCVLAMYHDQALIPMKLLAWDSAVNLTLGLPIIRTSPCHGTAFDIAGKDRADPSSMIAAIQLAIDIAEKNEKKEKHSGKT